MVQIKIILGLDDDDLQDRTNEFLKKIETDCLKDVRIDFDKHNALVLYEAKEIWEDRKCYDCKYWDDGGDSASVSGMCIEQGQRRRFNCKACPKFKDIREVTK